MKSLTAHDPRVFWNSKEFGSNPPQLVVQTATGLQSVTQNRSHWNWMHRQ